ncbi:MAG: two-component system, NtrC family, response regulator HydG [Acidobacteriota bacterium]|jgi:DNA-binding NtrC family response regulator/pSer/pThr/pTyr-binding forkhead associated (FHA) protein|nr:two-component system, NtrC family, response regulator HydG [Acidobacteriota bacterium]
MSPSDPLYVLKILSDDGSLVRRFPLSMGEHVVGSVAEVEIRLDTPGISRRHASIRVLADGGAVLADLGSKNGTWLAGKQIQETVVAQFAVIAFGPVQAILQPADATRERILLEPPPADATLVERPERPRSTRSYDPLDRLSETLQEELPALASGQSTPAGAASALAHRWLEALAVGRVEFLREGPSGEAVVAAASTSDLFPKPVASLEVQGPDGWKVRLRAQSTAELTRLTPLFRLTLEMLAVRTKRSRPAEAPVTKAEPVPPPPGLGAEMSRIYRSAGKVARGDVPVLILGESGSGKEVLARWVHARSRRASGPFLALNCAALPRELLEAELFGIERGVATGVEARPGLLERASGGTLFLDEIGDMAPETQAKVLRVLEGTSVYRVGGRAPVQVDVRFVAATNRELESLVEEGGFRRDLFHRLAAFQVKLPPLRTRREEIPSLAARFFHRELERNGLSSPGISRTALGALVGYSWPGNVRELQNEIAKAALLLEPGEPLDLQHLSERVRGPVPAPGTRPALLTLEEAVHQAEREAFSVALAAAGGDAGCAMELLGVSRTTWYRKIKELGLSEAEEESLVTASRPAAERHVM